MRQVSISQLSTMRWSFCEDVSQFSNFGFESIGVWREKVTDLGIEESIDLLYEAKLGVSSVHWAGAFTGSDGKTHVHALNDAVEAIELASRLEAGCLILHSGARNGHTKSHAKRLFRTAIQTLIPVAEDYGVRLAIEPMPLDAPNEWTILESLKETIDFVSQFDDSNVGLVLDLFHVGLDSQTFETLEDFASRIALVQLANRSHPDCAGIEHRTDLSAGRVSVLKWISRLQAVGYSGSYEVELHGPGIRGADYESILQTTRDFLSQSKIQSVLSKSSPQGEAIRVRPGRRH